MARTFVECRSKVANRGKPPLSFLNELVDWAIAAPDEIFASNAKYDVYAHIEAELGPWPAKDDRKAAMLEVLRVLGGFESSWDWNAGRDVTNPSSDQPCTEEAGIFQCSGNSMAFDPSLKALLVAVSGHSDCDTFRAVSKSNLLLLSNTRHVCCGLPPIITGRLSGERYMAGLSARQWRS